MYPLTFQSRIINKNLKKYSICQHTSQEPPSRNSDSSIDISDYYSLITSVNKEALPTLRLSMQIMFKHTLITSYKPFNLPSMWSLQTIKACFALGQHNALSTVLKSCTPSKVLCVSGHTNTCSQTPKVSTAYRLCRLI